MGFLERGNSKSKNKNTIEIKEKAKIFEIFPTRVFSKCMEIMGSETSVHNRICHLAFKKMKGKNTGFPGYHFMRLKQS